MRSLVAADACRQRGAYGHTHPAFVGTLRDASSRRSGCVSSPPFLWARAPGAGRCRDPNRIQLEMFFRHDHR